MSREALAAIDLFIHADVADPGGTLQGFRQHGVCGIDERLDQFHLHFFWGPPLLGYSSYTAHGGIVTHDITDDFVQYVGLYRLLDKMLCTLLQSGDHVFLIADGRHHDDARVRIVANDVLNCLDALHLRHGDIHEHEVWPRAVVFGDGGDSVSRLSGYLAAKRVDHLDQVLTREDRVVHYQEPKGTLLFAVN